MQYLHAEACARCPCFMAIYQVLGTTKSFLLKGRHLNYSSVVGCSFRNSKWLPPHHADTWIHVESGLSTYTSFLSQVAIPNCPPLLSTLIVPWSFLRCESWVSCKLRHFTSFLQITKHCLFLIHSIFSLDSQSLRCLCLPAKQFAKKSL